MTNIKISKYTNITGCFAFNRAVRWRLCNDEYRRRVIFQRIIISHVHQERRKRFCRQKLTWNVRENWSRVIFNDETNILGNNNKINVRREPDERLLHECLGEFGDRVLPFCYVLGVHLIPWRIKPSLVERNMNTDKYVSNFDDHLCHVVALHFPYRPWIFLEDNAPWHVSARANAW